MGTQINQCTASAKFGVLPPGPGLIGIPASQAGPGIDNPPDLLGQQGFANGLVSRVKFHHVCLHAKCPALAGQLQQSTAFGGIARKGFLQEDVTPRR